jgi:hypothetical protein
MRLQSPAKLNLPGMIAFHKCGQSSAAYEVTYRGQTLIESSREPLFDSCRVLVNMGLKGRLEMWGREPYPRMIVRDIELAARLTVVENLNEGPRFAGTVRTQVSLMATMRNSDCYLTVSAMAAI